MSFPADAVQRFFDNVSPEPNSGCWLWTASTTVDGYGNFTVQGKPVRAHRFSYELHRGPLGEMQCLHHCDTPPCVNPQHLFTGTHRDNMADRHRKGRDSKYVGVSQPGEENPMAKLTWEIVREIRREVAAGSKQAHMAKRFGVDRATVCYVVSGRIWRDDHYARTG